MFELFVFLLFNTQIQISGDDYSTGQPLFENVIQLQNLKALDRTVAQSQFLKIGQDHSVLVPPWMVSIVNERGTVVCSGGLIDKQWMLTAGHCLLNDQYVIRYKHAVKPVLDGLNIVSWQEESKHTHPIRECSFGSEYDLKLVNVAAVEVDEFIPLRTDQLLDSGDFTLLTAAYPKDTPRKLQLKMINDPDEAMRISCAYQKFKEADGYFETQGGVICKTDSGGIVVNHKNELTALISQACDVNATPVGENVEYCEQFSNITRTQPVTLNLVEQINDIINHFNRGTPTTSQAFCHAVFSG